MSTFGDTTVTKLTIGTTLTTPSIIDRTGSSGSNGQVLSRDANGIKWVNASSLLPSGTLSGNIGTKTSYDMYTNGYRYLTIRGSSISMPSSLSGTGATTSRNGTTLTFTKSVTNTATLTTSGWTSSAPSGSTSVSLSATDSNFTAANIKNGVTIFGLQGTYSGSTPTGNVSLNGLTIGSGFNVSGYATATLSSNSDIYFGNYGQSIKIEDYNISGYVNVHQEDGFVKTTFSNWSSDTWEIGREYGDYGSLTLAYNDPWQSNGYAKLVENGTYLGSNFTASNIKSGVSIFGVTGTFAGGIPGITQDFPADSIMVDVGQIDNNMIWFNNVGGSTVGDLTMFVSTGISHVIDSMNYGSVKFDISDATTIHLEDGNITTYIDPSCSGTLIDKNNTTVTFTSGKLNLPAVLVLEENDYIKSSSTAWSCAIKRGSTTVGSLSPSGVRELVLSPGYTYTITVGGSSSTNSWRFRVVSGTPTWGTTSNCTKTVGSDGLCTVKQSSTSNCTIQVTIS